MQRFRIAGWKWWKSLRIGLGERISQILIGFLGLEAAEILSEGTTQGSEANTTLAAEMGLVKSTLQAKDRQAGLGRMPYSALQCIVINFRCHRTGPERLRAGTAQLGFEVESQESMKKVVS